MALVVKNSPANAGVVREEGSIPGSGRSPGGGNGHPLQDSLLENPMDRGAWCPTVHGVTKSVTQLSNLTLSFQRLPLSETQENKMVWKYPLTVNY